MRENAGGLLIALAPAQQNAVRLPAGYGHDARVNERKIRTKEKKKKKNGICPFYVR
jgi:hypothetical protein